MKSKFIIYVPTETHEATTVSFTKVAGVPLYLRSVLSLASVGEKAVTVIAPISHRRHVLKNWQKIVGSRPIHLNLILTGPRNFLSADNVRELKEHCEQNCYFLNAGFVFTDPLDMLSATERTIGKSEVLLYKPLTRRMALVGVRTEAIDGLLDISIERFLTQMIEKRAHHYLMAGGNGLMVQKFSDIPLAEHTLTEQIRARTGTWCAREINKRISLPASLVLSHLRISPNTITVINMFLGLCAGIGAAGKTYTGVLIGAVLFQVASIVDGCDGEVAKLTFRQSKFGQYIDSISDNTSLAAFLTGMMIHQRRITGSHEAYFWGGALLIGVAAILGIMTSYLKKNTNSASFVTFDKEYLQKLSPANTPGWIVTLLKHCKFLFKKDSFSLMFLAFAILGILHWWFYIISVGVWIGVGVLFYLQILHKNKPVNT